MSVYPASLSYLIQHVVCGGNMSEETMTKEPGLLDTWWNISCGWFDVVFLEEFSHRKVCNSLEGQFFWGCTKVIYTLFLLFLQDLCSAELGGILREEPGRSESSSLAMHREELGRQGVCSRDSSLTNHRHDPSHSLIDLHLLQSRTFQWDGNKRCCWFWINCLNHITENKYRCKMKHRFFGLRNIWTRSLHRQTPEKQAGIRGNNSSQNLMSPTDQREWRH